MNREVTQETVWRDEEGFVIGTKSKSLSEIELDGIPYSPKQLWGKSANEDKLKFSSSTFYQYFTEIKPYIVVGNYISSKKGSKTAYPANAKKIQEILGISESPFKRFILECRRKNIIYSGSSSRGKTYFVNPAYYHIGTTICASLLGMFIHDDVFMNSLSRKTIASLRKRYGDDFADAFGDIEIDFDSAMGHRFETIKNDNNTYGI